MRKLLLLAAVVLTSFTACTESETKTKTAHTVEAQSLQRTTSDERKDIDAFKAKPQPTEAQLQEFRRSPNFNPRFEEEHPLPAAKKQAKICDLSPTVNISVDSNGCYHLASGSTHDEECHGSIWAQWTCFWNGE